MTLPPVPRSGVGHSVPSWPPKDSSGWSNATDPTTSQAISWAHPDFRVSAMTGDGVAFGIVKAYQGAGGDRYFLELSGVQFAPR